MLKDMAEKEMHNILLCDYKKYCMPNASPDAVPSEFQWHNY